MTWQTGLMAAIVIAQFPGAQLQIAPDTLSPITPGDHYENYDVPNPGCVGDDRIAHCAGLSFTFRLEQPICLRIEDAWVRRFDGWPVPFVTSESGTPGEVGYEFNIETPGDASGSGPMILHYRTVTCPKVAERRAEGKT